MCTQRKTIDSIEIFLRSPASADFRERSTYDKNSRNLLRAEMISYLKKDFKSRKGQEIKIVRKNKLKRNRKRITRAYWYEIGKQKNRLLHTD